MYHNTDTVIEVNKTAMVGAHGVNEEWKDGDAVSQGQSVDEVGK